MLEITYKAKSIILCCIFLLFTTVSINSVMASEWYEGGTLHEATFQQWKSAPFSNKLATCASFIQDAVQMGYFLHNVNNMNTLKKFSSELVIAISYYANNSSHVNDKISDAARLAMFQLEWVKPDYLILSKTANIASNPKDVPSLQEELPANNIHSQKVKVRKYRLMSPEAGRKWVKKNIIPSMVFAKDELVERLGNYEKATSTLSNNKTLDKYYFKRINITFLVIQDNQTIIGFTDGKGFLK